MADDFYGFDEEEHEEKGRDNLFLWTVFILLLIGVAFACWLGSFYIFGHPEHPRRRVDRCGLRRSVRRDTSALRSAPARRPRGRVG